MPNPRPYADFARRLFIAQRRYELKLGRELGRDTLAEAVAKAVKWGKPFSSSTVSQWFAGNQMPSVLQLEAIAKVLDAHPGWLAFGEQTEVISPDGGEPKASQEPPAQGRRRQ